MGKILKGSAAFLLSFVMLLTLSAGFGRPAAAETLNDICLQKASNLQEDPFIEGCTVKVESSIGVWNRFTVLYEKPDGTWVSVLNDMVGYVSPSREVVLPWTAKTIRIVGEIFKKDGSWEKICDEYVSGKQKFVYVKLVGDWDHPSYTLS